MKYTNYLVCTLLLLSLLSCGGYKPGPFTYVAQDKTQYTILGQKWIYYKGGKMFLIQYLSENLNDATIRSKELNDLYSIIASNLNPNSDFKYIGIDAYEKSTTVDEARKLKGSRAYKTFDEVMKLRAKITSEKMKSVLNFLDHKKTQETAE